VTQQNVLIEPHDPAIFRDARPFETGLGARTLPWATPSAVIGTIRTRLGAATVFNDAAVKRLRAIRHIGPFLACEAGGNWQVAFAPPADAIPYESEPPQEKLEFVPLRPDTLASQEGMDLPPGLHPLLGAKPRKESSRAPRFWRSSCSTGLLTPARDPSTGRPPTPAMPNSTATAACT
jgi:hypothetical protein